MESQDALACLVAVDKSLSSGFLEAVIKAGFYFTLFCTSINKASCWCIWLQRAGFILNFSCLGNCCLWKEPGCLVLKELMEY